MSAERGTIYNWDNHEGGPEKPVRSPRSRVEIGDETWRDGMQGTQAKHHPTTDQKAMYIEMAVKLFQIDNFDIGFPASGEIHRNELVTLIKRSRDKGHKVTFSAAGRGGVGDDVEAIIKVAELAKEPLRADLFLDPSTSRAVAERWDRKEKLKLTMENIAWAKKEGLPVMFVPERSSVTSPEELFEACVMAADQGVDRIAIADTTGVLTPYGTTMLLRFVYEHIGNKYPNIEWDFHEHEDLGMGLANCLVAAREGIDGLHATARGIGERAGNVNLEMLISVLSEKGFRKADTTKIQEFAKMAAKILNLPIGSHEPIIGEQSQDTSSGVHAKGYEAYELSGTRTTITPIYLAFKPEKFGLSPKVRIGPFSGIANVDAVCAELGLHPTKEQVQALLRIAKETLSILSDKDVLEILEDNSPK